MKINVIVHITTSCNYNCSYCDVIKDNKELSINNIEGVLYFIENNKNNIDRFKFFGGEPLLSWKNIKIIIDNSVKSIGNNFEIVTNTSLLNDDIGRYFNEYFKIIFFSVDTENTFDYYKIEKFINKYNLKNKLYFNLVINPNNEEKSLEQFKKLYDLGFRRFNILPVYFTKIWTKSNLLELSRVIKYILDLSLEDKKLKLYGFQENLGKKVKLANNTIFIDIDGKIYYSDIVSTFNGKKIKKDLFLGNINIYDLKKIWGKDFEKYKKNISNLELEIYNKVKGQKHLQKLMDYFSVYLNNKR